VRVFRQVFPGVLSVVALALVVACSGGQASTEKAAEPADAAPPDTPVSVPTVTVKVHMADHFTRVSEVEAAVVRGDMEGAKVGARWIADHQEIIGLPAAGRSSIEAMKRAAKAVVGAADIAVAAQGTADMAVACAGCHAASGSRPDIPPVAAPEPRDAAAGHMLLHQFAVDLLYRGLIAPSNEAWAQGALALKAAPLTNAPTPKTGTPSKEAAKAEDDVYALADKATAATGPKARAAVYAELVARCASCHSLYGRVLGEGKK
jgi:mono/diheme cytochrome c family protein